MNAKRTQHDSKKIPDLQRRCDAQYDVIAEVETRIEDVETQIQSIRQEKIPADNIDKPLPAFHELYRSATEMERKECMRAFIEKIEIYPEKRKDGCRVKKIVFNFPVPVNGEDANFQWLLEAVEYRFLSIFDGFALSFDASMGYNMMGLFLPDEQQLIRQNSAQKRTEAGARCGKAGTACRITANISRSMFIPSGRIKPWWRPSCPIRRRRSVYPTC